MKFSYDDMTAAKALLSRPADGSVANAQAREIAAHKLVIISESFARLAALKPETEVAGILREMAAECMTAAHTA